MSDPLDTIAKQLGVKPNGHDPRRVEIVHFRDLLKPNLETNGLVKGIIDRGSVVLVVGEPGCGKTFLTLDLALSVATGRAWFGHKTEAVRVTYVASEAGRSIRNRVAAWAKDHQRDKSGQVNFQAVVSPVDLCHLDNKEAGLLAAEIKNQGGADLVIIDTVSRAMAGGDENSPKDMGAFVFGLDKLREYLGCTVIAVHHLGKDASRGARGHSLLRCAVDTEISVERRDADICVATVTKQRDMPAGDEIAFRLRSVELGQDQDGDPVTSCVVEATDYVPEAKVKGPTGQAKLALDILNQAIGEHGQMVSCGGNDDVEVVARAIKPEVWRKAMEASQLFGEDAKFRVAWQRAQALLDKNGHISFGNGYVWPTKQVNHDIPF